MISIKKHDSLHYLLYIFILSQSVLVKLPSGPPLPPYQRHVKKFPISAKQIFCEHSLSAKHAPVLRHT